MYENSSAPVRCRVLLHKIKRLASLEEGTSLTLSRHSIERYTLIFLDRLSLSHGSLWCLLERKKKNLYGKTL